MSNKKKKIKILISLIGSNPLPIYTVCRYASMENRSTEDKEILPVPDRNLFVYTNNTENYLKNMKEKLEDKGIIIEDEWCFNLKDKQNDGDEIIEDLHKELKRINEKEEIDTIIINNTGGTKPMAVYSTIAILKFIKEQKRNIEEFECYLDASKNLIRVSSIIENFKKKCDNDINNDNDKYCPKNGDLRELLSDIELSEILYMHRMEHDDNEDIKPKRYEELVSSKSGKFVLEKETLKEFANIISKEENWKKYGDILGGLEAIRNSIYKKTNVYEIMSKHMELTDEEISEIKDILGNKIDIYDALTAKTYKKRCKYLCDLMNKEENKWIKDALPIFDDETMYNGNKKSENFYKYFNGVWLEHYLHLAIEDAIKMLKMEEKVKLYNSVVCKIVNGKAKPNFEVDLVVLKGYQIICFTCTIAEEEALLKSKAFEILHRAEQLGGEHAKLFIVNMSDDSDLLKEELTSFNSSVYNVDNIITRNEIGDYPKLVERLKDIIRD